MPAIALLLISVLFALTAVAAADVSTTVVVTILCSLVTFFLTFQQGMVLFRTRKNVGYFILLFGSAFWFWSEAFALALENPPFYSNDFFSPLGAAVLPTRVVSLAVLCVSLFSLFAALAWHLLPNKFTLLRIINRTDSKSAASGFDFILLVVAMSGWLPSLFALGSLSDAIAYSIMMRAGTIEHEAGLINYLPIGSLVAVSIALTRLSYGAPGNKFLRLVTILIGGFLVVVSGTRFKLLYAILPIIVTLLVDNSSAVSRRARKTVIVSFLTLLGGIASYQFFNRYGQISVAVGGDTLFLGAVVGAGHFTALVHSIILIPDEHPFFRQSMLPFFITDYVPRFLWETKPVHEFWEFYNARLAPSEFTNVTPSIIGQYYMNWGILGSVSAGTILGIWARIVDSSFNVIDVPRQNMSAAVSAMLAAFIFLSFRLYSPMYLTYPIFTLFLYYLGTERGRSPA